MILNDHQKFALRQRITDYAKSLGFDLVGFSPAKIEEKYLKAFEDWLGKGRHGTMTYMEKIEQRRDLSRTLPGAKSVVVLAMNYYHDQKPLSRGHGRVARYAYGRDYHKVIGKKLKEIEKFIAKLIPVPLSPSGTDLPLDMSTPQICHANCRTKSASNPSTPHVPQTTPPLTRSYVDTGPILERALAEQAGLGRIGKNGCLITKELGSWVFLSEVITTLDLNFHAPAISVPTSLDSLSKISPGKLSTTQSLTLAPDRWADPTQKSFNVCGNCNRCMTACPTGAIIAPGVVDSRLCISYLTIENKGKIPTKLAKIIKKTKRLYGCDICQEVCPHNDARQRISPNRPGLFSPIAGDSLNLKTLRPKNSSQKSPIKTDQQFLQTFAGSPLMRAKRKGLTRTSKLM